MISTLIQLIFFTGIVNLSMPPNPVCYNDKLDLICTVREDMKTQPVWWLRGNDEVFDITNGTMSEVTMKKMETKIIIKNISQLWAGTLVSVNVFTYT